MCICKRFKTNAGGFSSFMYTRNIIVKSETLYTKEWLSFREERRGRELCDRICKEVLKIDFILKQNEKVLHLNNSREKT